MDEPNHPRLRNYIHDHTIRWSQVVDAADAIVWVMPEYNHTFTAPVKNAIDYLHAEWAGKATAMVTYGGVSAGTRAGAALRVPLVAVGAVPVPGAVHIPFVSQFMDNGTFVADQGVTSAVTEVLGQTMRVVERESATSR